MLMTTTVIPDNRFRIVKTETVQITRALAQQFSQQLDVNQFSDQKDITLTDRKLKEARVRQLRQRYESGLLVVFNWYTVRVVQLGNKQLRINGQHSSYMLASLPEPFPTGLIANIVHYEVDSQEDAILLFRQIDPEWSSRKSEDVAYIYQAQHTELRSLNSDHSKKICVGLVWFRGKIPPATKQPKGDDRFTLVNEDGLRPFFVWADNILDLKERPYLNPDPVIGAMYRTFTKNPEKANEFWELISRQGVAYEDEHPTTVLYKWLKLVRKDRVYTKANGIGKVQVYWGCLYAWNAHREEKQIKEMRWDMTRDAIE